MNIRTIVFLSLLCAVQLYRLEETWKLRTSEIPTLKAANSPIYFEFDRSPSGDGLSMVGYLTITACNILTYNYEVVDSQIFLTFLRVGRVTRTCLSGQIAYLRSQLDETFYFYIMYSSLLLMPANSDLPIKLDISPTTTFPTINGLWTLTDPANRTSIDDASVIINGSLISFCQGSLTFNYQVTSNAKINLTPGQSLSACNGDILTIFGNSTRFLKVNTIESPQSITFYDQSVNVVLKFAYRGDYLSNKIILVSKSSFNSSVTSPGSNGSSLSIANTSITTTSSNTTSNSNKTVVNTTVNTQGLNNTQVNQTKSSIVNISAPSNPITPSNSSAVIVSLPINQSKPTNTSIIVNSNSSTNNISIVSNNSSNITINKTTLITSPQALNDTVIKNISNTTNITSATSTAQKNDSQTSANLTNSSKITPSLTYALVSQASQLFGVWFPSVTVIPSSLAQSDLVKYQIIFNSARIMMAGGCNTIFSTYSFASGSFKPNSITSTSNSCANNSDSTIQGIIFSPSNSYYLSGSGSSSKVSINSQNSTLLLLTQVPPS